MTLEELLALLPDNNIGAIDAADLRAIITDLWNRDIDPAVLDTTIAVLIGTPGSETDDALEATLGTYTSVESFRQSGFTDQQTWEAALAAAGTFSIRRLLAPKAQYTITAPLNFAGIHNLEIAGAGMHETTFVSGVASLAAVFAPTADASNITFRGLGFIGSAVDNVTAPRRARTYGPVGMQRGISVLGSRPSGPYFSNIRIYECYFYGTSNLPVFLQGISGESVIDQSVFENCYDVGFTYLDEGIFTNNIVRKSADNGVSMSRGVDRATIIGNSFENCAFWAIWVGGFAGTAGPKQIVITGNRGQMLGYGGVYGWLAPQDGTIAGNLFRDLRRGPSDVRTDIMGVGIFLSGGTVDSMADPAQNWTITGNTIIDAQRAGILFRGLKNAEISGNLVVRAGSQYLSDDTTPVGATTYTQNIGIGADHNYTSQIEYVHVHGNAIVDDRVTPYQNAGTHGGATIPETLWMYDNQIVGVRGVSTNSGRTSTYLSGAAGSTRSVWFRTLNDNRWRVWADSTAESSTQTGCDFRISRYTNAAAFIDDPFFLQRSTGQVRLQAYPVRVYAAATGSRPAANTAGAGSHMFDTTLGKPIWSNGTNWVDATGTTV